MRLLDVLAQNLDLLAYAVTTASAGVVLLKQVLTIWKLKLEIEKLRRDTAKPDPLPQLVIASAADLQCEIKSRRERLEKERNKLHAYDAAGLAALSAAIVANIPFLTYLLLAALTIFVGLTIILMRLDKEQEALLAQISDRAAKTAL